MIGPIAETQLIAGKLNKNISVSFVLQDALYQTQGCLTRHTVGIKVDTVLGRLGIMIIRRDSVWSFVYCAAANWDKCIIIIHMLTYLNVSMGSCGYFARWAR